MRYVSAFMFDDRSAWRAWAVAQTRDAEPTGSGGFGEQVNQAETPEAAAAMLDALFR